MGAIRDTVKHKTAFGLAACIGCNECLAACPVAPPSLKIADLNHATARIHEQAPPELVRRFAVECFQCGACVPPCPSGLERDSMVQWLKHGIKPLPAEYTTHLKTLEGGRSVAGRLGAAMHNLKVRGRLGSLAQHVDKRELKSTDTLFFFGCNIYSETGLGGRLLDLADYLGLAYEVLGGSRSCCGWPHQLAGEFDRSEAMMEKLHQRITRVAPREVVTIGAECYAALKRLVAVKGETFTPVTAASWIRRNLHRFPVERKGMTLTFHDACHVSRKLREGQEARRVIQQLGLLTELDPQGDTAPCCGQYQFDVNPEQVGAMRAERVAAAKESGAEVLVVECVRCLESFGPAAERAGIRVADLVDLIHDTISDDLRTAPQPVHFKPPVPADGTVPAEGT